MAKEKKLEIATTRRKRSNPYKPRPKGPILNRDTSSLNGIRKKKERGGNSGWMAGRAFCKHPFTSPLHIFVSLGSGFTILRRVAYVRLLAFFH